MVTTSDLIKLGLGILQEPDIKHEVSKVVEPLFNCVMENLMPYMYTVMTLFVVNVALSFAVLVIVIAMYRNTLLLISKQHVPIPTTVNVS